MTHVEVTDKQCFGRDCSDVLVLCTLSTWTVAMKSLNVGLAGHGAVRAPPHSCGRPGSPRGRRVWVGIMQGVGTLPPIKPDAHFLPLPFFKVTSVAHPLQKQFSENL